MIKTIKILQFVPLIGMIAIIVYSFKYGIYKRAWGKGYPLGNSWNFIISAIIQNVSILLIFSKILGIL